jgi:hypothetical protein
MNFTKFDISILLTMSLAVIVMSFTFPALGMTDSADTVNESDVPTFDAEANQFNLTGQIPRQPDTPTSGQLYYDATEGNSIGGVNQVWIQRPKNTGVSLELQNTSTEGFDVVFINFTSSGSQTARYDIANQQNQEILITEGDWTVRVNVVELENYGQSNMTAEARFEIDSSPADTEGLSSIPIIGGFADELANVVGYIASQIAFFSVLLTEVILNTLGTLLSLATYMFSMGSWLITTYSSIVSAAPGWAGVILLVPAILLFAELAKLLAIVISLFPTT